jgi:hypothetical protein
VRAGAPAQVQALHWEGRRVDVDGVLCMWQTRKHTRGVSVEHIHTSRGMAPERARQQSRHRGCGV